MGIDTTVWNPPESAEVTGFSYLMRYEAVPPTAASMAASGDRNITEWSDGSISANVELVDGTFRFQLEIPVTEDGYPGDWCTYIYGPTEPDETNAEIIDSLRFIRSDDASGVGSA